MDAQEVFQLAEEIAGEVFTEERGGLATGEDMLALAKIIVQCKQREFQAQGLEKIEEMVDRFLEDRAAPPPPLPVFHASGGSSPDSDLTTGLVAERQRPTEILHALLYTDAYGAVWFCLFDKEEDGEKERQRILDKGYDFLGFYHIDEDDKPTGYILAATAREQKDGDEE